MDWDAGRGAVCAAQVATNKRQAVRVDPVSVIFIRAAKLARKMAVES
jgi:hypothetical protein